MSDGYTPVLSKGLGMIMSLWESSLLMIVYLDCRMHLVFHGNVAYCVKQIDGFITDQGLTPKF